MNISISLDWLALYLGIIISAYVGYQEYSFTMILLVAIILLIVQIFTMPTDSGYSNNTKFMSRERFLTYSYNDLLS